MGYALESPSTRSAPHNSILSIYGDCYTLLVPLIIPTELVPRNEFIVVRSAVLKPRHKAFNSELVVAHRNTVAYGGEEWITVLYPEEVRARPRKRMVPTLTIES